jgi:hypothetical protein
MSDDIKNAVAEEVARQLAELKAKEAAPKSTFVPMSDEEHRDMVHRTRERQANAWMPPDAVREMVAAEPRGFMQGVALRDSRAPQGPGTSIPSSQQVSNVRTGGSNTPGWADPRPLGPQPGIDLIDRGVNAALPHGPGWGKEKK